MTRHRPLALDAAGFVAAIQRAAAAQRAAGDAFAGMAPHLAEDDRVEELVATCRTCGLATRGAWQHGGEGRRVRTPTEHPDADGGTCPGSFNLAALAVPTGEKTQ